MVAFSTSTRSIFGPVSCWVCTHDQWLRVGLDGQTAEVFERRLTPDHAEILEWIRSLSGMLDGDPGLDRAMGPMQFIPET